MSLRVCYPSTLRIVIWPDVSRDQNMAAVSAGQHGLRLDAALEFFAQSLDCVCGPHRSPLRSGHARGGDASPLLQLASRRQHRRTCLACFGLPSRSRRRSCRCSRPKFPRAARPAREPQRLHTTPSRSMRSVTRRIVEASISASCCALGGMPITPLIVDPSPACRWSGWPGRCFLIVRAVLVRVKAE